jgi:RHS repeat-associated protein
MIVLKNIFCNVNYFCFFDILQFTTTQDKSIPKSLVPQIRRADGLGGAWVGTEDYGVFHYQVDGKVSQFTTKNGLGDNNSYALAIDKLGRLAQQTRFDSDKPIIVTKNKFDQSGRLTNISHTGNGKTYADYDLTWDNGNRITDFDFTYLNGPAKRNESKYRYDKTSQLIAANYNFMQNEMYDFDLNGNRKTAKIQDKNESYKTGEYNRLLSDENYRYEYDQEGNRISKIDKDNKTTTKYFWDHRNRLTKVQTPTESIEYIYDYQNRLVKRIQDKSETHFVHNGWQIILQFENKEIKPTNRYLWGTKQDELICNNNNWTLCDHLNTIRDTIKSDGTVVSHLGYNAFGKLISEIKNDLLLFAYTGKLFDKSSDLQWNINRWYDSNAGRWISEDPARFNGKDHNLLRYAQNNMLVLTDINGLAPSGYIVSGARYCKVYHTNSFIHSNIMASHTFLAVNGESFGFYQQSNMPLGPGIVREDEFSGTPENVSNEEGLFSICKDIWIDGDCYDAKNFRDSLIEYKYFSTLDPPFYIIGLMDCIMWARSGIGYSLNMSRKIKSDEVSCACLHKYRDGDGFNYYLQY